MTSTVTCRQEDELVMGAERVPGVTTPMLKSTAMDDAKDREECKESLLGLAPCLPYVQGTGKAPTPDCCGGLKQVLKTNKKCLCVIVKDRNDPNLDLNINVTLALGLPQ
ncbi:non-specific lipid transfer protein GPI-anchored 14-like, partial [Primulina huaijiensis]|uniref:non-specific lipid transfer protein GPI-anchored 14-like n=1 Tax=Primulina huaijiensis TaxID=1492673 RepID=UPI003CC72D24